MKKIIYLLTVLCTLVTNAQTNYDIVILSKKFDFLKEENKYNLNALTKSFFESEGFKVFYAEDNLPIEIANNRCNALFVDVISNSGIFMTKLVVELKDCQNKDVFSSATGMSREKSYDKAYNEALRSALVSMRGNLKIKNKNASKKNEVNAVVVENTNTFSKDSEIEKTTQISNTTNHNQLFAIPTTTGYKLVDAKPVTKLLLQKTSVETVFIAQKEGVNGVFMKKINGWFFEYYQNEVLVSEKVEVKF